MKPGLSLLVALGLLAGAPAQAEKPERAGKGPEQQLRYERDAARTVGGEAAQTGQKAYRERERVEETQTKQKQAREQQPSGSAGLERQRELKQEQLRKEAGQGSEQGQASREEHSRKWWKFWE